MDINSCQWTITFLIYEQVTETTSLENNNCWGFKLIHFQLSKQKRESDMIIELYYINDVDRVDYNTSWQGNLKIINSFCRKQFVYINQVH